MQTLTMNDFGRELTMEELDLIAGGIDWGITAAGALGGAAGAAKWGAPLGPWGIAGAAALGGLAGGALGAAATWND
ncbi:Blp family class II bacteriocin [Neisseria sicca]|uniref:Blp family class II bacteriocin n=1 Tax=Neisseria sicca TaxID=490 RepID=UPI0002E10F03|nr:Blp family class II bacteriocin [Neisseria sicca]